MNNSVFTQSEVWPLFGGIGINIASHVLIRHFEPAEKRFERAHRNE